MKNYLFFFLILFSQTNGFAGFDPCDSATPISCGQPFNGTTFGGTSQFDNTQYTDCVNAEDPYDGNDMVFELFIPERQVIHIYLDILSHIDMDMFLFADCSEPECLASSFELNFFDNIYTESIEYIVKEPGFYYLIIDGKESNQNGNFSLKLNCECSCVENLNPLFAKSIRCENFDEYEATFIDPQSNRWRKWKANGKDGKVESMGPENMMRVQSIPPSAGDLYYSLSDLEINRHRISWRMFLEEGATGAYSLLNVLPNEAGNNSDPVYDVYFKSQDQGTVVMNGDTVAVFSFDGGNWNDVMQIVDPLHDTIEIWINHQFVFGSKYSVGANMPYSIRGIRFFTISNSNYLVDHICAWEMTGSGPGNCGQDSVCTASGGTFLDSCEAEQQLYSSMEYQECDATEVQKIFTVCDYGGSAVYRSDIFSGVFTEDDEVPGTLFTNDCVLQAFGGAIPPDYRVQIKVYYNDVGENIGPNLSTKDDSYLFVFRCVYNPDSNKVIEEYLGQINGGVGTCQEFNTGEDMPVGLYYFVLFGLIDNDYTLQVIPEGACNDLFKEINCGDTIIDILPDENNFDKEGLGDYAKCYNGTRTYTGGDLVYRFDITSPTRVNIRLSASDQKAAFLYNFLCGKNCLDYSETPPGGGIAEILDVSLLTGRYYIIVDRDSLSNDSFTLSMDCVPDYESIPRIFNNGDTICPVEDADENIHSLNIPITASTYLKNGAYLSIGYSDLQNKKNVISDYWTAPESIEFKLPQDSIGDAEQCGFLLNDTIFVTIYSPYNGSDYAWIPCRATYEDLIPNSITAQGNFMPQARSVIDTLIKTNLVSFTINPTFQNFSAQAQSAQFTVYSGEGYNITKDPGAGWLTLDYDEGDEIVDVTLIANPDQQKRETDLLVTIETDPPLYRTIHISQNGPCIDPIVTVVSQSGENSFCEGENVILNAVVVNGLEEYYDFAWNNEESTEQIAFTALNNATFTVTVTESECFESSTASINISVVDAPEVDAGPDVTICPGDTVTLNAIANPPTDYLWSTGQTTSQIIVKPDVETTYTVTITGEECDRSDSVTVFIFPVAEWAIQVDTPIKCNGDANGILSIVSNNGSQPQTVLWSNNTTSTINSNLMAGHYDVTVTDQYGCVHIEMFELTEPGEIQFPDTIIMHPTNGQNGSIQVVVTGGVPPYTYQWLDSLNHGISNDSILSGQMAGCYSLIVKDSHLCEAELGCIELITSILKVGQVEFNIFPNPTKDFIFIQCERPPTDKIAWYFRDLMGKVIRKGTWDEVSGSGQIIDITGIPQGCYLIHLQSGTYSGMEKIIVY